MLECQSGADPVATGWTFQRRINGTPLTRGLWRPSAFRPGGSSANGTLAGRGLEIPHDQLNMELDPGHGASGQVLGLPFHPRALRQLSVGLVGVEPGCRGVWLGRRKSHA